MGGAGTAGLLERRRRLLERCAGLRATAAAQFEVLSGPVGPLDRRLAALRRWAANPVVIGAALVAAVLVGRRIPTARLGVLASAASAGWSLRRLLAGVDRASRRGTGP